MTDKHEQSKMADKQARSITTDKHEQSKTADNQKQQNKKNTRGGKLFPALCSTLGLLAIISVILLLLPAFLPGLMGYEAYHVVSGSMEPAIARGSLVLVRPVSWREIEEGDVIAFGNRDEVITHRVAKIDLQENSFVTKGDANDEEDMSPVPFASLIGKVEKHVPMIGTFTAAVSGTEGKLYLAAVLLGGVLLRLLAGKMRRREERRE